VKLWSRCFPYWGPRRPPSTGLPEGASPLWTPPCKRQNSKTAKGNSIQSTPDKTTTRKPLKLFRASGLSLLRFAERQNSGLTSHEPPRSTWPAIRPDPSETRRKSRESAHKSLRVSRRQNQCSSARPPSLQELRRTGRPWTPQRVKEQRAKGYQISQGKKRPRPGNRSRCSGRRDCSRRGSPSDSTEDR